MKRDREYFVTFTRFVHRVDDAIGALRRLTIGPHLPFHSVAAFYRRRTDVSLVRLTVDGADWGPAQQAALRAWAQYERLPLLDTRTLCPSEWVTFYQHYLASFERNVVGFARPEAALHSLAWSLSCQAPDEVTPIDHRVLSAW